ncbi:ferredoxin [Candidatus Woesearchaeota archaeon]|nr:ferredoxin [Candidatus Woesearchaeota archaeon]
MPEKNKDKKFRIVHERSECIGCGSCTAIAEEFWTISDDGKVDLKGAKKVGLEEHLELDDLKDNMDAAECCPVNCIHIYEKGKKRI